MRTISTTLRRSVRLVLRVFFNGVSWVFTLVNYRVILTNLYVRRSSPIAVHRQKSGSRANVIRVGPLSNRSKTGLVCNMQLLHPERFFISTFPTFQDKVFRLVIPELTRLIEACYKVVRSVIVHGSRAPCTKDVTVRFRVPGTVQVVLVLEFHQVLPIVNNRRAKRSDPVPAVKLRLNFHIGNVGRVGQQIRRLGIVELSGRFAVCNVLTHVGKRETSAFPQDRSIGPLGRQLAHNGARLLFRVSVHGIRKGKQRVVFNTRVGHFRYTSFPNHTYSLDQVEIRLGFFRRH